VRPYIHVNRNPNNLRKPSSDLKLIALTKVSERSKRIVIAPPLAQRHGRALKHLSLTIKKQNPTGGREKKG